MRPVLPAVLVCRFVDPLNAILAQSLQTPSEVVQLVRVKTGSVPGRYATIRILAPALFLRQPISAARSESWRPGIDIVPIATGRVLAHNLDNSGLLLKTPVRSEVTHERPGTPFARQSQSTRHLGG
jgi:hypothetical protein